MASSSNTSQPDSSFTTVMAFRGNGFGVMASEGLGVTVPYLEESRNDATKIVKVCENGYMGSAGSSFCHYHVENFIPGCLAMHLQNPTSIEQVAHYIIGLINNSFAFEWSTKGEVGTFLFMGNIPFTNSFEIYRFEKERDTYHYKMSLVKKIICIGGGAEKLETQVRHMPNGMTDQQAYNYAYECIHRATQKDWCLGGKIKIVVIYLDGHPSGSYSRVGTYEQSNPAKCDSPYQVTSDITVSYEEARQALQPPPRNDEDEDDDDRDV